MKSQLHVSTRRSDAVQCEYMDETSKTKQGKGHW